MEITLETFKKLLHSLKNQDIGLKVKTHTGWSKDYLHIIGFIASVNDQKQSTFNGIVLSNLSETEGILINNITTIAAFELDAACDGFDAHQEYVLHDTRSLKALIIE